MWLVETGFVPAGSKWVQPGALSLRPVSARKQLFDLPDELATKVSIEFYSDAVDALVKAVLEQQKEARFIARKATTNG